LASGKPIQTIVINNKISNVCSGGDGVGNAEYVCQAVADLLELSGGVESVLPSSTGVIGWRLPAKELAEDVVPKAIADLQSETAYNAARDIMTTDRYPKLRSRTLSNGARIIGIAKVRDFLKCFALIFFFYDCTACLNYLYVYHTIPYANININLLPTISKGCWYD
jgi:N-acetylglutamate synthase/N-acetylornithine aminotransferase